MSCEECIYGDSNCALRKLYEDHGIAPSGNWFCPSEIKRTRPGQILDGPHTAPCKGE